MVSAPLSAAGFQMPGCTTSCSGWPPTRNMLSSADGMPSGCWAVNRSRKANIAARTVESSSDVVTRSSYTGSVLPSSHSRLVHRPLVGPPSGIRRVMTLTGDVQPEQDVVQPQPFEPYVGGIRQQPAERLFEPIELLGVRDQLAVDDRP